MPDENWKENYFNKRKIDLNKYFDEYQIEILNKLNIFLENKLYTEYEFESLEMELSKYYDNKEELKKLDISCDEFDRISKIFSKIEVDYNI